MKKLNQKTSGLVPVKNALSEELTHMRWSLIPNLMLSLENNIREFENLKLFELEKIFNLNWNNIEENYSLAWVELSEKEISYYDIQNTILNFFKTIWIDNYTFDYLDSIPSYAHPWRTAKIIVRWIQVWILWEIHPKVANNFWIEWRVWFFEININTIEDKLYTKTKAKDISTFQENNFDLNFVINKKTKWKNIKQAIEKTSPELITKVELIDIYENEEKLAWLRSLTFKIYIQSKEKTLDDNDKSKLIEEIIKKVEKLGWKLR
jgi:phenylalanyl-tRNA synthetase beta chain